MICKVCKIDKPKVQHKFVVLWQRWDYIDAEGGIWKGRTCCPCARSVKNAKERSRTKLNPAVRERGLVYKVKDKSELTDRKCRTCFKALPRSRYFNHLECTTNQEDQYSSYDYGYQYHGR